jgi:hypothetical protein
VDRTVGILEIHEYIEKDFRRQRQKSTGCCHHWARICGYELCGDKGQMRRSYFWMSEVGIALVVLPSYTLNTPDRIVSVEPPHDHAAGLLLGINL